MLPKNVTFFLDDRKKIGSTDSYSGRYRSVIIFFNQSKLCEISIKMRTWNYT